MNGHSYLLSEACCRRFAKGFSRFLVIVSLITSGQAFAVQLVVGQVAPMSGLDAAQGRAYAAGMQLHFDAVNRAGGANGHTLALVRRDDAGKPEDTVGLTRQMIAEDKPIVVAGYFGAKNIMDLIESGILEREKLALVGFRASELGVDAPQLFSVRAGPREEIRKLIEHLATIGISRVGLFHEASATADATVSYVGIVAREFKVQVDVRASYPAKTSAVGSAVTTFVKNPPQAIIMLSSGAASAAFVEQYRSGGGMAQLFAHSGADIEQLSKRLAEEQMQGVAIAQVTPSPYKISTRVSKEFREAAAKAPTKLDVPVSYAMMEGYLAARVIAEALRRQGANPSRAGTLKALETLGDFDAGGYLISFKPGQRTGSKYVELSIVTSAGRIRQ